MLSSYNYRKTDKLGGRCVTAARLLFIINTYSSTQRRIVLCERVEVRFCVQLNIKIFQNASFLFFTRISDLKHFFLHIIRHCRIRHVSVVKYEYRGGSRPLVCGFITQDPNVRISQYKRFK